MAGTSGQPSAAVDSPYASLLADPRSFTLQQAVRILFHVHGRDRSIMQFISEDLRIRPHLSLGFPPTDIVALEEIKRGDRSLFRLTVSMLGLYGASSPLPDFYTEELLQEQAEDRSGSRNFLDLLNSGIYHLFLWAACFRYHPLRAITEQHDKKLIGIFKALAGLEGEFDYLQAGLAGLAGLLSLYPRSAASLQSFLTSLLGVPVRVRECAPRRAHIPAEQRARLGDGPALSEAALLGCLADDLEGKVTLYLGPLSREEFLYFSPCSPGYAYLEKIFDFFCAEPLSYDLSLLMAPAGPGSGARLGQTAFGCLNGDAWLSLAPGRAEEALFPDQGIYPAGGLEEYYHA
jgi:type VI secretion system protein ImpH